jgi:aspartate/glutamate racemase
MTDPISDPAALFSEYLRVTGVARLEHEWAGDPRLAGKRLGLLNGSSWIALWSSYFGRLILPEVNLISAGNDAVQLYSMRSHRRGQEVPPQANVERFVRYAMDLVELAEVDAVLITCSTMNRSYPKVAKALKPYGVPVLAIDMPMMEAAVERGGKVLVVATHGPTVLSTQAMLDEAALRMGKTISYRAITIERAWQELSSGRVESHNRALAEGIAAELLKDSYDSVVLAQLSMSAFLFSYPDPEAEFGLPVLTSGQCGFERARQLMLASA